MTARTLYLSDLDGTLLNAQGELSERSRSGLLELLDRGVNFTVASARSHFSISKLFGDIPFALPIIEFNGAFLTDYKTGEHLEVNSLGKELGEEIYDLVLKAGQRPFVCSYNGEEDCLHFDEIANGGMAWYEKRRRDAGDPRLRQTVDLRATMGEEVVSLTVMDQGESKIRALYEQLHEKYGRLLQLYCYENEYSPGTWWLTIHHEKASKHIAMQSLKERFCAGAELVALGDNINDIEMLRSADRAIVVENAVPEVLQVASTVIGDHDKNSVIDFLERDSSGRS